MTYDNIPGELQALVQWCVWKFEQPEGDAKPTKVPYNPKTGKRVSSTDPATWCAFAEAVAAVRDNPATYAGIGFVFSSRDPYCGIDLDASEDPDICRRQQFIFDSFNSYAEFSPSGRGLHIIVKASVPHGRKRDAVEIYSSARFFTMTGNVYRNAPIAEYQELANQLWAEMAPPRSSSNGFISSLSQELDDQSVFDIAASAVNGDKFVDLYTGNWRQHYSSQSEADLALINIISYYTQFIPQIVRMFRASELGKRAKAQRDAYVNQMIERSFDNQPPPMDISAILDRLEAEKAKLLNSGQEGPVERVSEIPLPSPEKVAESAPTPAPASSSLPYETAYGYDPRNPETYRLDRWQQEKPRGMLASLIDFYMAASPRPVYEMSLTSALGLMCGIVGRQFNVSGTGLNQYFILVAETGKGKEVVGSNIAKTVNALAERLPVANDILGPAEIASGQALLRHLSGRKVPCFVTVTGEFGIRLKQLTDPRAGAAEKTLLRVLLDLYNKSGAGDSVQPSIYADKQNNTDKVHSPAFSLIGEGVPDTFYKALDEESVAAGLLPRLTIIEYNGPRVPTNYAHATVRMPVNLATALEQLITFVQNAANRGMVYTVGETPDATVMLRAIDAYSDHQINYSDGDMIKQIWNRVHLKVYKLAALIAVSNDYERPIITADMVEWAASLIFTDAKRLIAKFQAGEMGEREVTESDFQLFRMGEVIKRYVMSEFHELPKMGAVERLHAKKIISYTYIQRSLVKVAAFRKARPNATAAIKQTIDEFIRTGHLARVGPKQLSELDYTGDAYQILKLE